MSRLRSIAGRRLVAAIAAAALIVAGGAAPSRAAASTTYATETATSSNWAGYVATGAEYSSVAGSWVVPTAKPSSEGYSAAWVGLGGASGSSSALEQVGTESDYVDGQAIYSAWYELVPKAPVTLKLAVHPGDRISAKVAVSGTTVTVSLSDFTTGRSATKVLHMADPDTSSAEWIAEAPSVQTAYGSQVVPLADFGKVKFSGASATADGHTGTIADPAWTAERVDLISAGGGPSRFAAAESATAEATTSGLASSGSAFSVSWNGDTATAGQYGYGGGWRHSPGPGF